MSDRSTLAPLGTLARYRGLPLPCKAKMNVYTRGQRFPQLAWGLHRVYEKAQGKMQSSATLIAHVSSYLLMACALLCASCTEQSPDPQASDEYRAPKTVLEIADEVLAAFQLKDGRRLASLVHPKRGVRFSPSAYVNLEEDVVLSRDQAGAFWTDKKSYLWGYAEGSGEPIEMTPAAYAARYILLQDNDFSRPSSTNVNCDRAVGTTRNNAPDAYPTATRVEYYIEPREGGSEGGTDWAALRFVFESAEGSWRLIAVIHDSWSP